MDTPRPPWAASEPEENSAIPGRSPEGQRGGSLPSLRVRVMNGSLLESICVFPATVANKPKRVPQWLQVFGVVGSYSREGQNGCSRSFPSGPDSRCRLFPCCSRTAVIVRVKPGEEPQVRRDTCLWNQRPRRGPHLPVHVPSVRLSHGPIPRQEG